MPQDQQNKALDAGKRSFTKRLVSGNVVAAWGSIWLAIYLGAAEVVVPSMCVLITGLIGVYSGTGHLDYRAFLGRGRGGDPE